MGTRSLTFIYDNDEVFLCMYKQYDGYPSGYGKDLFKFLNGKNLVNGIGENKLVFNGMGCLAAQLVSEFKDGAGDIYIYPATTKDAGQDFEYHIKSKDGVITVDVVGCNGAEFSGTVSEFGEYIDSEKNGD